MELWFSSRKQNNGACMSHTVFKDIKTSLIKLICQTLHSTPTLPPALLFHNTNEQSLNRKEILKLHERGFLQLYN